LRRTDEVQAVLSVIRVMAVTPHGSWEGCPHFGFRDFFEQARTRPDLPQMAMQEMNLALKDLGITDLQVASIAKETQMNRDVDSYVVTLASTLEAGKTYAVTV
jgi:hypothetical protein